MMVQAEELLTQHQNDRTKEHIRQPRDKSIYILEILIIFKRASLTWHLYLDDP